MCSVSLCASGLSNLICGTVSFWHFLFLPGFLGMAHSAAHERCTNNKATRVSLPHHFVEFDSVLYYYYYNCYHHHYYLSFLIFSIILVIIITIYIHIYIYILYIRMHALLHSMVRPHTVGEGIRIGWHAVPHIQNAYTCNAHILFWLVLGRVTRICTYV